MIYDSFANFDRYREVAPAVWDKVKTFLIKASQSASPGKFPIADNCFANVAEYDTAELNPDKLEAHVDYLDIQITLRGDEAIACRDTADLETVHEYSKEKDIAFYRMLPDAVTTLVIGNGRFAVFYPGEGHLPGLQAEPGSPQRVLKVIVKIHHSYL